MPDDKWGESPHAFVVLRKGASVDASTLGEYVRSRLAHFKCPREVEFVDALPREDNGKIYKRRLRETYRSLRSTAEGSSR